MNYQLNKPYCTDEETNEAEGGCVFCGKMIQHFNDGGVGWSLVAKDPEGKLVEHLYCCHPMCPEAEANDAAEIHRCYNPEHGYVPMQGKNWQLDPTQTYDSCDNFSSYIEFVGPTCPECGGTVAEVDARLYDPRWSKFFQKKEA